MDAYERTFKHDVKEAVLKAYLSIFNWKFSLIQKETDQDKIQKIELELYEIIHTLEEMVKSD